LENLDRQLPSFPEMLVRDTGCAPATRL